MEEFTEDWMMKEIKEINDMNLNSEKKLMLELFAINLKLLSENKINNIEDYEKFKSKILNSENFSYTHENFY